MLIGKEKHLILFAVSLLFSAFTAGQAGKTFKYHFNGDLQKGSVFSGEQNLTINYSISELNLESIKNSYGDFYKIYIPGHNPTSDPGKPELPVFSRIITVPENCSYEIKISEIKSQNILPYQADFKGVLFPKQAGETKAVQKQKTGFIIDKTLYSSRGIIKSDTVRVEYLGKVRNKRLAVIYISPIRYNPYSNELEVITSMKIEITFDRVKGLTKSYYPEESVLFNQSLEKGVLNYNPDDVIPGYTDQPVKMIILTDTAFRKYLDPFIKWKTQKGYKIITLYRGTGSGQAGTTYTQIKDTLTKIYNSGSVNNPAPEYLLIVGDVNRIPRSAPDDISNISDLYYGEFDGGGDYIPEIYIGRLPVSDTSELKAVVRKILQYEKFEFADTNNFYSRALVTAGNDGGYDDFMNGQVKYAASNYLNSSNHIEGYHFYYPQSASTSTIDSIKKLINKGLSFLNYTGHGSSDGWLYSQSGSSYYLKVSDVSLMGNKNMFPFVISNACRTAQYNIKESFGNVMMVSSDRGALGYIGCSNDSYWDEDFYWAVGNRTPVADPKYSGTGLGALDRLFHTNGESPSDWYISMGQVNYAGNLAVSASTSTKKKYYWESYNLLGDPSIVPFIGQPDSFNITLPDKLPNGIKSLSLAVEPFAYIAVSHFDTLWDASYSSPSGSVVLEMPGLSNDSCLIVITGQNKIPVIKKIYFSDTADEYINLTSTLINDGLGNRNGVADWGESFFLKLTISNLGSKEATGLYAKVSTASDWATIISDSAHIGSLAGKSQIILSNDIAIKIADYIPDKGTITLNLKLKDSETEKNFIIDILIHAPVLEIINCTVNDSETGNNNSIADPGETFDLVFKLNNSGSSDISGTFNIINYPAGLTILQPTVGTDVLKYGFSTLIPISVQLSSSVQPGSTIELNTSLDCAPYFKSKSFSIPVGKTRESFEYQSFTIFPWNNTSAHPWIITDKTSYEGQYSARSAFISSNNESELEMSLNVPVIDTLRFFVKVSSELNYDFLYFKLNGTQLFKISGETGWIEKKIGLKEGINLLEWIYVKDESVTTGEDCAWLDNIIFPVSSFSKIDLKTGKIVTPEPDKSYNQELITAQVINLGTDTIKSFNLAYIINDNLPVIQNFIKTINSGDTAEVVFTQPADLSGDGTYQLKVYGINNNDNYLYNDTASLTIINTDITPVENTGNMLNIMPNPFSQYFRIIFDSRVNDEIRIAIFNTAGKLMWEEERSIIPGENILTVNPAQLTPGLYTLRISGEKTFKSVRIVKSE